MTQPMHSRLNNEQFISRVVHELQPSQLLPSLTAGFVIGILTIIFATSLAALIFGHLSGFVSNGIGLALFGAIILGVVITLLARFRQRYDHQGKLAKAMSASAYAVYVCHAPILVFVSLGLRG